MCLSTSLWVPINIFISILLALFLGLSTKMIIVDNAKSVNLDV